MNHISNNQRIIIKWALENQSNVIGVVPCLDHQPHDTNEWLRHKVGEIDISGLQSVYDKGHVYFICRTKDILGLRSKFFHERRGNVIIKDIESSYSKQISEMKEEMNTCIREITND